MWGAYVHKRLPCRNVEGDREHNFGLRPLYYDTFVHVTVAHICYQNIKLPYVTRYVLYDVNHYILGTLKLCKLQINIRVYMIFVA
jgi:hypothetical protein